MCWAWATATTRATCTCHVSSRTGQHTWHATAMPKQRRPQVSLQESAGQLSRSAVACTHGRPSMRTAQQYASAYVGAGGMLACLSSTLLLMLEGLELCCGLQMASASKCSVQAWRLLCVYVRVPCCPCHCACYAGPDAGCRTWEQCPSIPVLKQMR